MRRMMISITIIAGLLAGSSGALADRLRKHDRDDVAGPIDIRSVAHSHRGKPLVHTIRTFERWRNRALRNESSWIALLFDRREKSFKDDRYLRIDYSKEKGLHARMTTFGTHGPGEFIGRVAVWRPTRRSVRVSFPRRFIARDLKRYEWRAITSYEDEDACSSTVDSADQGGCIDYAPGKRRRGVVHDLDP